jgi:PDZ domain/Peptide-N-glycosidase F, C terminal
MRRLLLALPLLVLAPPRAGAAPDTPPGVCLSRFGEGEGPTAQGGVYHLLDAARSPDQSNALAFDRSGEGARERVTLACRMRVLEGGDGGSFLFLSTAEYGVRGPAPFLPSAVEPNLRGTFAVGIDVHDPPSQETFTPWGNYQGLPQREVSLHWDGREIVKRVAPEEFRGEDVEVEIDLRAVVGGAEATVRIGKGTVYDHAFVPGVVPYEMRLAIAAGTRADATTTFDVSDVALTLGERAKPRRRPHHVEVFNHVLTNGAKTAFDEEVALPPAEFAFGRVLMTIDLHDAGPDWDEWDRNGEVSVWTKDGEKMPVVPFITSYRTPCHWTVDVTWLRPLLAGTTRLEIAAGTTFYKNRGFMMSLSLDFYPGTADPEPWRVVPVWVGTAHHGPPENHFQDFFAPQTVAIPAETTAARLVVTTTGHSQVGEFTPSRREIVFTPDAAASPPVERRFENALWKTDCYLNPNRPQLGTWQFSRAGWAPGDVVRPWWIDLSPDLEPGKDALLRYVTHEYDFSAEDEKPTQEEIAKAQQVVRAYLVLYRAPSALVPAPTLVVADVSKGSNAERAGVKAGDYLASYDGKVVGSLDDLRAALQAAQASGRPEVAIVLYRGADRIEVTLPPGRMGVALRGE